MIIIFTKNDEEFTDDVKSYRNMVYRLAFSYSGNHFDADDITQDVFLRYHDKKSFKDNEHKKAFLIRVTINTSKNVLKSSWHKKRLNLTEFDLPYNENFKDDEEELKSYILRLKPKYRAVLYFYYYEEYSIEQIAKILKLSQSNIKTQLHRARGQLKEIINSEPP